MRDVKKNIIASMGISLAFAVAFFCRLDVNAKALKSFEIGIKDTGDGYYEPESYDIKDGSGNYALITIDSAFWGEKEITFGEFREVKEKELPNGGTVSQKFMSSDDSVGEYYLEYAGGSDEEKKETDKKTVKAYLIETITNSDGDVIFRIGKQKGGDLEIFIDGGDGNFAQYVYSYDLCEVKSKDSTTITAAYTTVISDNPRNISIFDADTNELRTYVSGENFGLTGYRLSKKNEYDESGNLLKQSRYDFFSEEEGDLPEEEYLLYSAETESLEDTEISCFVNKFTGFDETTGDAVYEKTLTTKTLKLPFVIVGKDTELFMHVLSDSLDPDLSEGEGEDNPFYFGGDHYEALIQDELYKYEEVKEKYPGFLWDASLAVDLSSGGAIETEGFDEGSYQPEEEFNDPVLNSEPVERKTQVENKKYYYSMDNGDEIWMQPITGDVSPINGRTPWALCTYKSADGKQILLQIYDDAGGIITALEGKDLKHTDYDYVYFTELNASDSGAVTFKVAGTNEPK